MDHTQEAPSLNDQAKMSLLRQYYRHNKVMPTYEEICALFGFKSKNAAFKLVNRWAEEGYIDKMEKGRLKPGAKFLGLPLFFSVPAGPATAEEAVSTADRMDLNDYLIKKPENTVMIHVRGDSMEGAGIMDGDVVLVEERARTVTNDIVVAIVDGEFTVKFLERENGKPSLRPANPNYDVIRPRESLEIFGKVVGVVRKM